MSSDRERPGGGLTGPSAATPASSGTGQPQAWSQSLGPRRLILDIFGSFVRDFGGWIAVANLLRLLETLGVGTGASRAAISRMKGKDILRSETRDGRKGYTLTEDAEEWFSDGTNRIFSTKDEPAATRWLLATFSVPEADRDVRYRIRTRLTGLGFGHLSGGLMVAPIAIREETERALERAGLLEHVALWVADYLGSTAEDRIVASGWDLDLIHRAYRDYLSAVASLTKADAPSSDEEAFVGYIRNVSQWRDLPFLDPGLPRSLLPEDWPAPEARNRFHRIADRYRAGAWRYVIRSMTDTG